MPTFKITLAYDGTDFAGWQIQQSRRPSTVQGELERVFRHILRERVRVMGSGRTDAGVHAKGQVAHAKIRSPIPPAKLHRALNALLPPEIVVLKVQDAPDGFHARYDAVAKRYHYHIMNARVVLPFHRRYVHHVTVPLNVALMRREARALRGRHDFRAFQKTGRPAAPPARRGTSSAARTVPPRSARDTRRTLFDVRVSARTGGWITLDVTGDGFLYGMVRRIAGTLIDVGRGFRPAGTTASLLKTKDFRLAPPTARRGAGLAGPMAPARGLCLVSVRYNSNKR